MRISYWSSDVCSSDLKQITPRLFVAHVEEPAEYLDGVVNMGSSHSGSFQNWRVNAYLAVKHYIGSVSEAHASLGAIVLKAEQVHHLLPEGLRGVELDKLDRKSTRLNSSH